MMKVYDCTRVINPDMTMYPGDPAPKLMWVSQPDEGQPITQSAIKMGMHTGTHIDTPLHFIPNGRSLDEIPLDHFIGPCRLVEISSDKEVIALEDVVPLDVKYGEIILFKTHNSLMEEDLSFIDQYVVLDENAAQHLADRGVKTVGVDYLSVDRVGRDEVHNILLGNGICLIEGLYLKDAPPGDYFLSALPLRVAGAEASPVRAVLVDMNESDWNNMDH